MTKNVILLLLLLPVLAFSQNTEKQKKLLMVVSSYGKNLGTLRPGFEFDEFTQAYLIFKSNGIEVDIASPKGGVAEPDEFNKDKPYNSVIINDKKVMELLKRTIPTASVNALDYNAIYIVGGKGAMFDLPYDPSLQEIIASVNHSAGILASVCHGSAAFVNIKLPDGRYLVNGKKVTGFCNEEETMFGKKWKDEFPFQLENRLKDRGSVYEKAAMMLPHVSIDGNLITGQNPYSTTASAEEVVKAMNKKINHRVPYADELSMNIIKKALASKDFNLAKNEILKLKDSVDIELIAIYGYYSLLAARDNVDEIKSGLSIIELATPFYNHASLSLEQAKGYKKLGEKEKAKKILEGVLQKEPNLESVKKALADL